jgi:hypothetical protein
MSGIGPDLLDLATLAAGKWTPAQRAALVAAYRGTDSPPPNDFHRSFTLCRLLLAIHSLARSPAWSAPTDHQHDWLTEALTLAESLHF